MFSPPVVDVLSASHQFPHMHFFLLGGGTQVPFPEGFKVLSHFVQPLWFITCQYTHTETILSGFEQWSFLRKDLKHMWMNLWDCKPMTFQTRVDNAQFFLCFIAQGSPLFLFFWCTFRPFQICNLVIESSLSSSTLTWMIITDKDNFKFAQLEIFGFQLLPTLRSDYAKTKTRSLGIE